MIDNKDNALKIAEVLLKVKAVKLQPNQPFTWASGWKSPIYCDNRVTLSYPKERTHIRQAFVEAILNRFGRPDVIAGVATGGIPQGALVAQELGLPFIYIRSASKGHGLGNMIEGHYENGQRVVLVEDLISTGGSSLKAVEVIRNAKLEVKGLAAIFSYGFKEAIDNFKQAECPFITLTDYTILIEKALGSHYISENDLTLLENWREDPSNWKQEK
ncbi:MAG: orotate phosphoribosyltransferase [Bacteroidetes bacterium]|nr:orotate phosphoribosyltransferase [Bacteroidota bacterium]